MKRFWTFCLLVSTIFSFVSCSYPREYDMSPGYQPLTKWVADNCDMEIYVTDRNEGILVYSLPTQKVTYDVIFMAGFDMLVFDRNQTVDFRETDYNYLADESPRGYLVASASYDPATTKTCEFRFSDERVDIGAFPKEKITFRRTNTDVNVNDIPEIAVNSEYIHCPIFSLGSRWRSEDGKITIEMESELPKGGVVPYTYQIVGKLMFSDDPGAKTYICFSEIGLQAYVFQSGQPDLAIDIGMDDTIKQTDVWRCEFREDGFTAEVVTSDRYDAGVKFNFFRCEELADTE